MKDLINYLSKSFPKEWGEFQEYLHSQTGLTVAEIRMVDFINYLIEWLDNKGVSVIFNKTCSSWWCQVEDVNFFVDGYGSYSSRAEATIEGIKKAFEIINKGE